MTSKLKIAIAIPTYNRLEKLQYALKRIEAQEIDSRFELHCVISNIASSDGTHEYLKTLQSNTIRYHIWNTPEKNIFVNWRRCAEAVPKDIDWVWFHGDDDYLTSPQVIKGLVDILEKQSDAKLALIHVCQARRSQKTGKIIRGNLFDLCNQLGYHEILGWMSSIVIRNTKFVPAIMRSTKPLADGLTADELLTHKISAYRHSASFLEECINDEALFLDVPWVEPQDTEQTQESIARWQESHEGERYFYVVDDILALYEKGLIQKKISPIFFRYLTYSFWDRYAAFLIAGTIQTGTISERNLGHWTRIRQIADLFELERDKKIFVQWYESLSNYITHYAKLHDEVISQKKNLIDQYQMTNAPVYPFEVLGPNGTFVR